ncbi:MAG: phosphate acetyl/butaryl transferase [Gemmatimonadetes bacterium]|nr:phosphate acetyl/butaryl transferase [Gemmatimonadota bacterium]
MSFLAAVRARAQANRRTIVFPESADQRTLDAVRLLAAEQVVDPVLVLDPAQPASHAAARALGLPCIDPAADDRHEQAAEAIAFARQRKGMTIEEARRLAATPLLFADWLVSVGAADGCVAGAVHTTADVLRAAIWMVGRGEGVRTVSSAFYMVVPPFRGGTESEVLTFTDCAVVPYPGRDQLADIAIAAAADRRRIVGDEPRVALLSFSTKGSGTGSSVELMRSTVEEIRRRMPELVVDGELQGDAALASAVGDRKAPGSPVAGRANVLVFPTLDAGNIAYKLVQRLAGASAVGPIIQGLRRPCSDLSRGAVPDDIINVAAITALQAGSPGQEPKPQGKAQ